MLKVWKVVFGGVDEWFTITPSITCETAIEATVTVAIPQGRAMRRLWDENPSAMKGAGVMTVAVGAKGWNS